MRMGRITKQFTATCAICAATYVFHGNEGKIAGALKEGGWGLTKEIGWVCRACLETSEPLQNLLPESEQIVKDQPISE